MTQNPLSQKDKPCSMIRTTDRRARLTWSASMCLWSLAKHSK